MIAFTAAEIAEITNGRLAAEPGVTPGSVVTDSREATPGSLYVAKPGETADGHDFVAAAFERGAVLALVEHDVTDDAGRTYPAVVVQDSVLAMGALAAEAVRRIRAGRAANGEPLTVIGITGSAGKTTTKDLLAGILGAEGSTVAPQGSYNGEVGVPLTVFKAGPDTRFLVIEMGATGVGHISYLAGMVRPDIGVVLGVGTAHAGEFGGVENIAIAKGELVEALPAGGTAVLNLDDARVAAMAARTRAAVLGFSAAPASAGLSGETGTGPAGAECVRAEGIELNSGGSPEFEVLFPGGTPPHHIAAKLIGAHHIGNLLAAAAAAHAAGVPAARIAASLSSQSAASRWRMERTERADGVTIINDAYNANPESMRAALRTLADLGRGRRTWAVLGAMLELGPDSIREHMAVGTQVVRLNISRLLVVGREARSLYVSAVNEGSWGNECVFAETADEAYELLQAELEPGDLVLFKSSNSIGLRHLGDRIALPLQAPGTVSGAAGGSAAVSAAGDTAGTATEGSALP
ncbi:UDP-N-acetylmuramoyl-tripeptide--D-alanyl-D-alanine ligase [Arthrobacter sp. AL08]|uniref:UDP-N-acetylmuramoyl-tripeptide--D-alanyl-D- alanine ligase n=1 Tax=unclassified Arthrobacter TaxID=235627 RepID=UPI001D0005FD|nr:MULTISPECIES: UDP-N-acetylmuramoyl-tripeptide--D-alanyl-D-alanine ligase [unclassified Arthrobacter]MCB5281656.1 UDP-N-acetylmuramoyl-tripeptide--D-alanyl-D-alanine ligase [Arthrobacter sp. ES1]MDI3241681.1 UDP-N-acetylmuramoyl-tripeptide--D-alanyl-D-alanine ligase [Arthrobacter sp. AL05]MDI3277691.1 UDP-N-acetylmuramoyl-tripeptide--D-alanyl-D-alanine ligase [Arthrobacter sp. AL08]WGZ80558.1 UDP-N-acetylmuramoyl-tripeptide--D-alanyl-D-alanine ligase [Arthrobacter sp. EM1]